MSTILSQWQRNAYNQHRLDGIIHSLRSPEEFVDIAAYLFADDSEDRDAAYQRGIALCNHFLANADAAQVRRLQGLVERRPLDPTVWSKFLTHERDRDKSGWGNCKDAIEALSAYLDLKTPNYELLSAIYQNADILDITQLSTGEKASFLKHWQRQILLEVIAARLQNVKATAAEQQEPEAEEDGGEQ